MPPLEKHIADSLERFEKQFPNLNDSTEEGGYEAKGYVKDFLNKSLLQLLEIARGEVEKLEFEHIEYDFEDGGDSEYRDRRNAVDSAKRGGEQVMKRKVLDTLIIKEK